MTFVIGHGDANSGSAISSHIGRLGSYRARDGSHGADIGLDLDGPHAMLVVGKRGYGKSFTLGVIAEELARAEGIAPIVIDPMGVFTHLAEPADGPPVPATVIENPTVRPDTLDPKSWCALVGLEAESGPGSLLWRSAQRASSLEGMARIIDESDAPPATIRSARNHLELAGSWGVFDTDGVAASTLEETAVTVLDVSGLADAPMNAIVRGVAETLYRGRMTGEITRLPWLLLDEAHTFFGGVARPALETILTRGRAPGVSLVVATQRPSAVPPVGISQADITIAHRLTARADLEALEAAQPTYLNGTLEDRLPEQPGDVLVIDDATETVHAAKIRWRETPHGGESPRASAVSACTREEVALDGEIGRNTGEEA